MEQDLTQDLPPMFNDLPPIGVPSQAQPCVFDHEGDHGLPTVPSAMDERRDGTLPALCRRCLRGHLSIAEQGLAEFIDAAEHGDHLDGDPLSLFDRLKEIAWYTLTLATWPPEETTHD